MTTFATVCTGIGAPEVAWEFLGWTPLWMAEIEAAPSSVLAHHWPRVPNMGDMTRLPMLVRMGLLPAPDVLCGGTPCQAYSLAGLRLGLEDERGQLTLKFVELADAIDSRRPEGDECVVVWENVPGVLSDATNAFGHFLAGLAGEDVPLVVPGGKWPNAGAVVGPARAVAWRIVDAQYFGVAQRRRRVLVVASAREGFDPAAVLFEFDGLRRDSAPRREAREEIAGGFEIGPSGGRLTDVTPTLDCRAKNGPVQNQIGAGVLVQAFGGNRTSGPLDVATTLSSSSPSGRLDFASDTFVAVDFRNLTDTGDLAHALQVGGHGVSPNNTPHVAVCVHADAIGRTGDAVTPSADAAGRVRLRNPGLGIIEDGTIYNLMASGQVHAVCAPVAFSCKDYGADASSAPGRAMRAMGHSGSHANAGGQLAVCVTGDITHTLKAEGFDASEDGTGRGQPIVPVAFDARQDCMSSFEVFGALGSSSPQAQAVAYRHAEQRPIWRVRRLTPKECERLQGFPDGHTLVPHRGKPMADGPRYKALGNSMCVYKMRWLGERIAAFR